MKILYYAVAVTVMAVLSGGSSNVFASNVFNCPGNGITPDFEHETSTIYIPHLFFGVQDIYRDVFIELQPDDGNFSRGRYEILFGNNIPQLIQCASGWPKSNECPALEQLMCP